MNVMIEDGIQANNPNDFILMFIKLLLAIIGAGMLLRCIAIGLQAIVEGKEIKEALRSMRRRLFVIALAASTMEIIELIEEAFK